MTRVLTGLAMAWLTALTPAFAGVDPTIKMTRGADRATVTLVTETLSVTETLTRTALDIQLVQGDDQLRVYCDLDGRVLVERGERAKQATERRTMSMRTAQQSERSLVTALLAESPALANFDGLMQSSWARSSEAAAVLKPARELIRVLQGDFQSIAAMASARPLASTVSLVRVAQRSPSQCWDTYARDVIHFTYELQSCLNSASYSWWNPLATGWCAYEYNLKSSLASIWLLDCYGVPI
jgi:hypothetical protein